MLSRRKAPHTTLNPAPSTLNPAFNLATTQVSTAADSRLVQDVARQVARRVVGQDYMVDRLLISLLAGGHVRREGVPGRGTTLTGQAPAETINPTFHRIQFTPDLPPAAVVGTQV